MKIRPVGAKDTATLAELRHALWPRGSVADHAAAVEAYVNEPGRTINLLALDDAGAPAGFAEASLRGDYVNGCSTSPVAFLEGIYVVPRMRGHGVARALVATVEDWARQLGCREFASDAALDNFASHAMHRALGFAETQRVVYFRKELT